MLTVETYSQRTNELVAQNASDDIVFGMALNAYREIKNNPALLNEIKELRLVAQTLTHILSFRRINDIDARQAIASLAYFLVSKAIIVEPNNRNLYKDRILITILEKESFNYTILSALNDELMSPFSITYAIKSRENSVAIVKMQMFDFSVGGEALIRLAPIFQKTFMKNMDLIMGGRFGENADIDALMAEGKVAHKKVYDYLFQKLIEEQDLDF